MTLEISSVTGLRSGIAAFIRGFIFAWAVCSMPTRAAGPDYQCLARMGRIEEVYGQA